MCNTTVSKTDINKLLEVLEFSPNGFVQDVKHDTAFNFFSFKYFQGIEFTLVI